VADIRYYDVGFIDEGYMDDTVDTTGYYLEGYMTDDYMLSVSNSGVVKEGECVMAVSSVKTITPSKIMSTTVVMTAFNTVSMTVSAIKNNFAILTSSSSLLATVSKIAGNVITLDTIVNQSLQGDITRQLNFTASASFTSTNISIATKELTSNFADAFSLTASLDIIGITLQLSASMTVVSSLTASGIKPTRITTFVNKTGPVFDPIEIDNAVYKFGSGGYRKDVTGNEENPDRGPIWDGTYWRMFENNYQWTSTNLTDWTRSSNNLPVTVTSYIGDVEYLNGEWILASGGSYFVSSDSTATWTEVDVDSASVQGFGRPTTDTMNQANVVYFNSKWWIHSQRGIYSKSTLSNTGWSEELYYGTYSNAEFFRGGLHSNGNQVVYSHFTYPSGFGYFNNYIRKITVNGSITNNDNALGSGEQAMPAGHYIRHVATAQDNNEIYYVLGNTTNTSFELRTVGQSSAKLTNSYGFHYPGRINGKYYYTAIDADGQWTTYFGNSFATATLLDYPVIGVEGIRYENGYYVYTFNDHLVYSSNGTTWTYELVDELLSLNNRGITYTNTSLTNWKSIDFWGKFTKVNPVYNNSSYPLFRIGQTEFYLYEFDGSRTAIRVYDKHDNNYGNYSNLFDNSLITTPHSNATYNNHFRIIRNGNDFKAYLNGALSLEATVEGSLTSNTITLGMGQFGSSFDSTVYLDEFYVSTELLNDYSDNTITIPTTTWSNDEDAALLLHFNGTFEDFVEPPTTVNLSASFTLSATAIADKGLVALFATLGTLTTNATSTRELESTQVAATTTNVIGHRVKQFNAVLDAHTSIVASGITVTNTEFSVTANTTLITNVFLQRNVTPVFESVATTVTITSKIADMFVNVNTTATMTINAQAISGNIVVINSPATMVTVPAIIARTSVLCPATTALVATPTKIQKLATNQVANATQVANAFKVAQGTSTISGSMVFEFGVEVGRVGDIDAIAHFSMSVTGNRNRTIESSLNSIFASQITAFKAVEVNTTLAVITAQLATGRISHILEIVYTIPSEDRIFTIHKEDRTHAIFNEDRTYKIGE
jgi:hypothetical protein